MSSHRLAQNPFMLMLYPEVVLAAMEQSKPLNELNRHACRPLDRHMPGTGAETEADADDERDSVREADMGRQIS